MKKLFTVVAVIALVCNAAQAKTWRINNDPEAKADFLSINDAMASLDVFDGDVLYLDPGCRLPSQTVSKSVTIIGTGYNLTESEEAMVDGITISANDIKLTGINVSGKITWSKACHNITIERCKVEGISVYDSSVPCEGVKIIGCYSIGTVDGGESSTILRNSIILGIVRNFDNGIISNNTVIYDTGKETGSLVSYPLAAMIKNSTITNNVIINTTTYTTTTDNVVTHWSYRTIYNTDVASGNNITNNVLSTDADHTWADFPTNKFIGATVEDIFVNEGNQEEKYRLKAGSAAIGYGTNGVDCGAFGGMYPYVLCGRPQFVPYIYDAQIPATSTNGKLNITLKVKSQNE